MKITAHIRMTDTGRFEGKCKTLPGCPVIEDRLFPQVLENLQKAIRKEFIEQFYGGEDPGHVEIEATAMSASLTFSLDRIEPVNHSIFDFGLSRREDDDSTQPTIEVEPRALPESTRTEGWAPAWRGPTYHYYVGDLPLCGCAEPRGGSHQVEMPLPALPFGPSPACKQCQAVLEFAKEHGDPEEADEGEGWAPEALYPTPSHNGHRWHYYQDGAPVCGHANPRSGDLQTWPPAAGACPACIEFLHKVELSQTPEHEADRIDRLMQYISTDCPETPEEKAARLQYEEDPQSKVSRPDAPEPHIWDKAVVPGEPVSETPARRMIIGWGRKALQEPGPYHAIGLDGMAICGRLKSPLTVSTDHPEAGERVCKVCWGLIAGKADVAEEGEEAVEE